MEIWLSKRRCGPIVRGDALVDQKHHCDACIISWGWNLRAGSTGSDLVQGLRCGDSGFKDQG